MKRLLLLALVAILFCSGCGVNFKEAKECVDSYIEEFAEGKYGDMYALLDDTLRAEITYDDFERYHKGLTARWGDIEGFEGPKVKINFSSPRIVTYIYTLHFERAWGAYFLAVSQKKGQTRISFIHFISQKEAEEMTGAIIDKLPDIGMFGALKRKTKTLMREGGQYKKGGGS